MEHHIACAQRIASFCASKKGHARTSQTSPASPGSVACAGRAAKRRSHTATVPADAPVAARCGRDGCTATQFICRSTSCAPRGSGSSGRCLWPCPLVMSSGAVHLSEGIPLSSLDFQSFRACAPCEAQARIFMRQDTLEPHTAAEGTHCEPPQRGAPGGAPFQRRALCRRASALPAVPHLQAACRSRSSVFNACSATVTVPNLLAAESGHEPGFWSSMQALLSLCLRVEVREHFEDSPIVHVFRQLPGTCIMGLVRLPMHRLGVV